MMQNTYLFSASRGCFTGVLFSFPGVLFFWRTLGKRASASREMYLKFSYPIREHLIRYFLYNVRGCTSQATCQKKANRKSYHQSYCYLFAALWPWKQTTSNPSFAQFFVHDVKENLGERIAAQNPGIEKHVKGVLLVLRISSGHCFLVFFLQLHLTDLVKKGLLVVQSRKASSHFLPINALVLGGVIINQ